jgi:hypothetical protein
VFAAGKSLTIENCVIRGLTSHGIRFQAQASSTLAVSNTFIADNGGSGIIVPPSGSGIVKVAIDHVEVHNSVFSGIVVDGSNSTGAVNAIVTDSIAANNGSIGFLSNSAQSKANTILMVLRSIALGNGTGISAVSTGAAPTAVVRIGQSAVTDNTISWSGSGGGVLRSYGDNYIDGNGDGDPSPSTIVRK